MRGYDSDGDFADGHVNICVDDDSPDKCKVEISFGDGEEDNRLVHDETKGVQDGDDDLNDPDATDAFQDEDDVLDIDSFDSLGLTAIGFAKTQINVDLGGGTGNPDAAYGADGPGTTSPVSIVNSSGGAFDGEKSNLHDTKTGASIYLFTEGDLVVGRVGGVGGEIAFALHVSDAGELEMAQYRAIEHPDTGTRDESVTLLDCNGKDAIIHLQVTVTDADGDAVTACTPLDGCHGNPSIVFQDDGPVVSCADGTLVLAMDESLDLLPLHTGKDKDFPETDGVQDGSAFENDVIVHALDLIKAGLNGLPLLPVPIGAAAGNVKGLFSVDFGTDDGCKVCYALTIQCATTNLVDTATQSVITLSQTPGGIVEGRDGSNNLVFAVWVDEESGDIVSAQYRAIDHGDEEGAPGAHDEVAFLKDGTIGVTATAYDKDGDFGLENRRHQPFDLVRR